MKEEQDELIQSLNLQQEDVIEDKTQFQKNTMLPQLKKDFYAIDKNKKFISSDLTRIDFINCRNIFISALISLSFYFLFIIVVVEPDTTSIVLLIIIFIIGHFAQSQVIPEFPTFLSREEFEEKLKEILGCYVTIVAKAKNKEYKYLANYTLDVTGKMSIPNNIKLAKFGECLIYTDKAYKEFSKKIKEAIKVNSFTYKTRLCKLEDDTDITFSERIYCINELGTTPPVNMITILLSIILLQWIQAVYYFFNWKMIVISPVKLVTSSMGTSPPPPCEIIVHGKKYKSKEYVLKEIEEDENSVELSNCYNKIIEEREEKKREKEEKKKRKVEEEKEKRENTTELNYYSTNNYSLTIIKYYDNVYLDIEVFQRGKDIKKKDILLGKYDPDIEGEEEEEDADSTIYHPPGVDTPIYVTEVSAYKYRIKAAKFVDTFYYESES